MTLPMTPERENSCIWYNQMELDIAYLEALPPSEHRDRLLRLCRAVKSLGVRKFNQALEKRYVTPVFD